MTNEQAKQEAIKRAWKSFSNYDVIKKDIDENGVYHFTDVNLIVSGLQYIPENDGYRPFSLSGIETNNGWVRIEPDGSNLPTDKSKKYNIALNDLMHHIPCDWSGVMSAYREFRITHWREFHIPKHLY